MSHSSTGPQSASPGYDRSGTRMVALFDFAEDFSEDVLDDSNGSVQIAVSYANLDGKTLGVFTPLLNTIQMDTGRTWLIDETPGDNGDFTMSQTLWRDLAFARQSSTGHCGAAKLSSGANSTRRPTRPTSTLG